MKPIFLLLTVLFSLVLVSGRNLHDFTSDDEERDIVHDHANSQKRHRRRSQQPFYNPFYNDYYRRDFYGGQQEEILFKILDELKEIKHYYKNAQVAPPPPQIIYVTVPYPVIQSAQPTQSTQTTHTNGNIPNITLTDRWPEMEDNNQNWGQTVEEHELDFDDNSDGSRPINLDPVELDGPTVKPPPVEHGSTQAGMTTKSPLPLTNLGQCKAATLVCCQYAGDQEKQKCFKQYGCRKTFTGIHCHPDVVKKVIAEFAESYAPTSKT